MIRVFIQYNSAGTPVSAQEVPENFNATMSHPGGIHYSFKSEDEARKVAGLLGDKYLWIDEGSHVSPRYWIIKRFQIGEMVSYGFNGDSYPCGKIVAITDSLRKITTRTDDGKVCIFWRRRNSGAWKYNRTWSLMRGVHNDRNPSF